MQFGLLVSFERKAKAIPTGVCALEDIGQEKVLGSDTALLAVLVACIVAGIAVVIAVVAIILWVDVDIAVIGQRRRRLIRKGGIHGGLYKV